MKTVVQFDSNKCSGCWACTMTCADQNDLKLGEGDKPYRLVTQIETGNPGLACVDYRMNGCMHCEDAACIAICPKQCFYRNEAGLVVMDGEACIRCRLCMRACPHGAILLNLDGAIRKCNGCAERVQAGMKPACEQICPSGAIIFQLKNN